MNTRLYEEDKKTGDIKEWNSFLGNEPTADELIKSLFTYIKNNESRQESLRKRLIDAEDSLAKDKKIAELIAENKRLSEDYYRGFPISIEEEEKIKAWIDDWFERNNPDRYLGASGGGFTYKFYPTALGTAGTIIAPNGEEFTFQEIG